MKWSDFFQIIIIFILFFGGLIYSILKFQEAKIDTYFLISFILVILTIVLSIYYSEKTNNVFNQITEKIQSIKDDNKDIGNKINALDKKVDKQGEQDITEEKINKLEEKIKEYDK